METISQILESRLRAALAEFGSADPNVQPIADARFGDYQTNIAMVLAKQQRANPRQLAAAIVEKLDVSEFCAPPEIAGPGFINFRLTPAWLSRHFVTFAADEYLGVPRPAEAPEHHRRFLLAECGEADARRPYPLDHSRRCARSHRRVCRAPRRARQPHRRLGNAIRNVARRLEIGAQSRQPSRPIRSRKWSGSTS